MAVVSMESRKPFALRDAFSETIPRGINENAGERFSKKLGNDDARRIATRSAKDRAMIDPREIGSALQGPAPWRYSLAVRDST